MPEDTAGYWIAGAAVATLAAGFGAIALLTIERPERVTSAPRPLTDEERAAARKRAMAWEPGDPIDPAMPLLQQGMSDQLVRDPVAWKKRDLAVRAHSGEKIPLGVGWGESRSHKGRWPEKAVRPEDVPVIDRPDYMMLIREEPSLLERAFDSSPYGRVVRK